LLSYFSGINPLSSSSVWNEMQDDKEIQMNKNWKMDFFMVISFNQYND